MQFAAARAQIAVPAGAAGPVREAGRAEIISRIGRAEPSGAFCARAHCFWGVGRFGDLGREWEISIRRLGGQWVEIGILGCGLEWRKVESIRVV